MKGVTLFLFNLLLLLPTITHVQSREVVKFDYGWRHKLYPQLECPATSFIYNVTDLQCYGLSEVHASSADLCRDACCAQATCEIWQFIVSPTRNIHCHVGISNNCTSTKLKIVGGRRDRVVLPSPEGSVTPETQRNYDDSKWDLVDVPHDSLISQPYSPVNELTDAYLPKNQTWYRKHFNLPTEWKGLSIWLYFEGIFRASTVYMNGNRLSYHDNGYTSFVVRLDNASNVTYGTGTKNANVLAVKCLASGNNGWWYEGSGIYRHVWLIATNHTHIVPDTVRVIANITGPMAPHVKAKLARGVFANTTLDLQVNVTNDNATESIKGVIVRFTVFNEAKVKVNTAESAKVNISASGNALVSAKLPIKNAEMWSNLRPYLYTLQVEVMSGVVVFDSVNTTIGIRRASWTPNSGFHLNGVSFVWRGFNNHANFAGIGIAIPDRIHLFQAQSMRSMGGNSWRTSYNPPAPNLLDVFDRLGILVWNENRAFGDVKEWVQDFEDFVRRDRNHPSIMVWSMCTGDECNVYDWVNVSRKFKMAAKEMDPTRPVSANLIANNNSNILDIEGLSRASGVNYDQIHKLFPAKPLIGSECCFCPSQRGEDDPTQLTFGSFNAQCIQMQSAVQLSRAFVSGCMSYTLFDHYGGPNFQRLHVSSSSGAFDLAGFPKSSSYWYRIWWLLNGRLNPVIKNYIPINPPMIVEPVQDPDSEDTTAGVLVHIVQHWDERPNAVQHTIHVYTNAPQADLVVNGESKGIKQITQNGWAEWTGIYFIPGSLKAYALNVQGDIVATHTIETAGLPTKVLLGLDVPSVATGTGSSLVLDGQDTGMVHASIVDAHGNLVNMATNNVTFKVVSGPGRIIGVGNGDPTCREPNKATWRSAYHGLVRAVIQVTQDQASSWLHRKRLMQIDRDGGVNTVIVPPGYEQPLVDIVVEASSEGLTSSQVTIPVSAAPSDDSVLSVAVRATHIKAHGV